MTTDRAHAAEDEYFRNEEAERRRFESLELEHAVRTAQAARDEGEERSIRRVARSSEIHGHARRDALRRLNRLIVAGWGESLALAEAQRVLPEPDEQRRLARLLERRRTFRLELGKAVVACGGVPAQRASIAAHCLAWARSLRRLVSGPHGGDAYAACARAVERSADAYVRVLGSSLPDEVRSSVERQQAEVELDGGHLRRLRWGAPTRLPSDASEAGGLQGSR